MAESVSRPVRASFSIEQECNRGRGETLTVTEHRQVVAILRPAEALSPIDRLVAEGRAKAATRRPADLPRALTLRLTTPLSRVVDQQREDTI